MDNIEWSDKFSVGVKVLDDQHQTLVRMINKMIDTPRIGANSSIITEMLTDMLEYAALHFDTEEKLMKEHGYPGYDRQRAEHGEFVRRTEELFSEGRRQVDTVPESILLFLRDWWANHILIDDMRYKSFFKDKAL